MADSTERLLVRIDATTEQLRRELKKADDAVGKSTAKIQVDLAKIGKAFAVLGAGIAAGLTAAFVKGMQGMAERERAMAQLESVLKSTGAAAGKTAEELTTTAAALQKVSINTEEAIIGAQSMLATFKEVKGDNFDRATAAILDMSQAMGQDLKSSAIQVGKALNDPIKGLGALTRVGVQFTDAQKDLIKNMAETGRVAEAQVIILKELESQFGGSAEAARNTLSGALFGLSEAFDALFEAQGSALEPMKKSLNELEAILTDPAFVAAAQELAAALMGIGAAAASSLISLSQLGPSIAAAVGGIATDDIPRLEKALAKANEELAVYEKFGLNNVGSDRLREKIAKLEAQLKTAYGFQENLVVSTSKLAAVQTTGAKAAEATAAATVA
jgi:hypothetical protein